LPPQDPLSPQGSDESSTPVGTPSGGAAASPDPAPSPAAEGNPDAEPTRESPWAFWRSVLITLAVALGVRQFLLEARYIPSGSMLPGLQIQDRLLVEKLSYRTRPPRRGEIVVFHSPYHFDPVLTSQGKASPLQCLLVNIPGIGALPGLQQPACDAFIKRVIGLPGEQVSVDPRGRVRINGRPLAEPYMKNPCKVDSQGVGPCRPINVLVPPGTVLVLGDNRANSWDARFWPGGPFLPQQEIIGRAFWRFLPFSTWGSLGPTNPPNP
jgi:signal peptidase I